MINPSCEHDYDNLSWEEKPEGRSLPKEFYPVCPFCKPEKEDMTKQKSCVHDNYEYWYRLDRRQKVVGVYEKKDHPLCPICPKPKDFTKSNYILIDEYSSTQDLVYKIHELEIRIKQLEESK